MTIQTVRTGIKDNIEATLTDLSVYTHPTGSIVAPAVILHLSDVEFRQTMQRGLSELRFDVIVLLEQGEMIDAGQQLDDLMDPGAGASSLIGAIEADRTLGGAAKDCIVDSGNDVGIMEIGGRSYLAGQLRMRAYPA